VGDGDGFGVRADYMGGARRLGRGCHGPTPGFQVSTKHPLHKSCQHTLLLFFSQLHSERTSVD
jgi:hypothetical protein